MSSRQTRQYSDLPKSCTIRQNTPDILDTGPVFEVSPNTSEFLMRPAGAAVQAPLGSLPLQPGSESDCAPVLGEPLAYTLNGPIPDSDAPAMTFPVYPLPSGLALLPVSRSAQTVLASGVSSQQIRWSSDVPRTRDFSREDPFEAYCVPMDTEDCPLVATGLPGCPYRITSYTDPAVADTNLAFGMQLHHPRFLEFIGAPESARLLYHSPTFWIQRMGEEDAVAAAVNLQRDAGVMLSNLQILSQFVISLQQRCLIWRWVMSYSPHRRSRLCLRRCGRLGRHSIWP